MTNIIKLRSEGTIPTHFYQQHNYASGANVVSYTSQAVMVAFWRYGDVAPLPWSSTVFMLVQESWWGLYLDSLPEKSHMWKASMSRKRHKGCSNSLPPNQDRTPCHIGQYLDAIPQNWERSRFLVHMATLHGVVFYTEMGSFEPRD